MRKCKLCGREMRIAHRQGQHKRLFCYVCRKKEHQKISDAPKIRRVRVAKPIAARQPVGEFVIRISIEQVR
jgi:hypothetical protein